MVELAVNPVDSYDLTVETPIAIDTLIKLLNIEDVPMLGGINADGYPTVAKQPVNNRIFYWQDQDLPIPRTTAAEALAYLESPAPSEALLADEDLFTAKNLVALQNTRIGNLMGLCAVTVPTGVPSTGIMLQGPGEEDVLPLALAAEKALA